MSIHFPLNISADGDLDLGVSDFTTGGKLIIDIDGTAINAAGSLTMGAGADASVYWDGTNLVLDTASGAAIDMTAAGTSIGTWDAGGIDLVTGDTYAINGADVLNATTLGSAVVASSLTSVGTLTGLTSSGIVSVDDTTQSTSATTGSIHTDGGLGVAKDTYCGGDVHFASNGLAVNSATNTVGDDAAISFTGPGNGWFFVTAGNSEQGFGYLKDGAATLVGGTANFEVNNSVLGGTTGTDGKVTFGRTGGTTYLENRAGLSRTFSVSYLGGAGGL